MAKKKLPWFQIRVEANVNGITRQFMLEYQEGWPSNPDNRFIRKKLSEYNNTDIKDVQDLNILWMK